MNSQKITRIDRARGGRHYQVEGFDELFPSVTTVLGVINKPALIPWARNVALESVRAALEGQDGAVVPINTEWIDQVIATAKAQPDRLKTDAADFGTAAHVLIEQIIQGLEPPVPPEMERVVENFTAWRDSAGLDIHFTEKMVFSGKYKYAGAMDAVAYRHGQMVVVDWKTSNGLYREYALQVAAYARALEEMTGEKVTEAWAVRFGKARPEFEARQVADLDSAFIAFRAALYLWKAMQGEAFRG